MKVKKIQKGKKYDMIKNNLHFLKRKVALTLAAIMTFSFVADVRQVGIQKINATETKVTYGDVNSDGTINLLDMILLKSYLTENNTKSFSVEAADVDDDGEVSAKDAVELSMYLMNQIGSFSYEMNVDTDGDGLSDYIEKEILGTKYDIPDSDGDDLDDYSEVYLCETDPNKPDTNDTGIKDSLKDADEDGLTNLEEIKLGTSPTLSDSDEDELSDYDEVKKYKTDPNKLYSDDDLISDFAEVKLGLNPLIEKSDGTISDSERIFDQQLTSDNIILNEINTEDNPYKLSLFTKSSGYIDESVSVCISAYSNYLQNNAIEGDIVDIDYCDEFKVEKLTVNFEVSDNADSYYIFRYFEDVNMILPVETQYDGNRIYTESTEDGTYCIININKMASVLSDQQEQYFIPDNVGSANDKGTDLFFVLFQTVDTCAEVRKEVAEATREILTSAHNKGNDDVHIYYITYMGQVVNVPDRNQNYIDYNTIKNDDTIIENVLSKSWRLINSVDKIANENYLFFKAFCEMRSDVKESDRPLSDDPQIQYLLDSIYLNSGDGDKYNYNYPDDEIDSFTEIASAEENKNREKYCFIFDNEFIPVIGDTYVSGSYNLIDTFRDNYGVDFTFITTPDNKNNDYYSHMSGSNQLAYFESGKTKNMILNTVFSENLFTYNYNTGLFGKILLSKEITYDWYKAANGELSADEIKELGLPDSDGDGKYDFEEIIWDYVTIKDGQIIFPTFEQLCKNNDLSSTGIIQFMHKCKLKGIEIDIANTRVVLLRSNPKMIDSDYDGTDDMDDITPSREGATEIDANTIDDSEIFNDNTQKSIDVKQNGELKYINLEGSDTIKKPVVTYTRYANSKKRTISKYRILFSSKCTDYKITVKSDYKNKFNIGIFRTIDATKSINYNIKEDINNNTVTYTFSTLSSGWAYENESSPSWEYYIELYISPNDDIPNGDNKYTICFEEDNWIYVPNGGVAYNDAKKYSAVYLKDEALRVLADYDEEDWEKYKDKKNFSISIAAYLGEMFYSDNEQYLGMENNKIYQTAGDVSTISTYCGFILSIGSNIPKVGPIIGAFADIATATGVVTTYIASYPVGRQDFEDNIKETLSKNCSKDMSISLHKYNGLGEQFESNLWSNDYVYRYYKLDNSLKTILRTDFKSL